ncbi:MAG: sodium:solute symporter family protein, partial [Calditrichaeota bacterium]|nr:sodium:solute symporter family protein [Calditrichota bacterium]
MLISSIIIYILFTIAIGFWASKRIHYTEDFTLAGKSLSTVVVGVTIFATWFGAELVMGMPNQFVSHGIQGIIADQFGVFLCLVLIAVFYAKKMYQLQIVTINDFFRIRFNRSIELVSSILILPVYFAWVAAQFLALAVIFNSVLNVPVSIGILIAAFTVLIYTYVGGMWAVSLTDLIQSIMIIIGLLILLITLMDMSEPLADIIAKKPDGFFNFLPDNGWINWLNYLALWFAFGIGSIPSQEIYQRVFSAKSVKAGVNGVYFSAGLLFIVGIIPILIGLIAADLHPELMAINGGENLIPDIVSLYMSTPVQVLFFGALISAILSTSSGALLAPATIIAENIIKGKNTAIPDQRLLYLTRLSVIFVAIVSAIFALLGSSVHELVIIASVFLMVSLFIPFTLGLFWKRFSN